MMAADSFFETLLETFWRASAPYNGAGAFQGLKRPAGFVPSWGLGGG